MPDNKVEGSFPTLCVGVLEVISNLVDLGLYIQVLTDASWIFSKEVSGEDMMVVVRGVYMIMAFAGNVALIYSTLPSKKMTTRRAVCIGWIVFRILWIIITIAALIALKWWNDLSRLAEAIIFMVVWSIFTGVAIYYVTKLNLAIQEDKLIGSTGSNGNKRQKNVIAPLPPLKERVDRSAQPAAEI